MHRRIMPQAAWPAPTAHAAEGGSALEADGGFAVRPDIPWRAVGFVPGLTTAHADISQHPVVQFLQLHPRLKGGEHAAEKDGPAMRAGDRRGPQGGGVAKMGGHWKGLSSSV
jgi:hypothetical protein